MPGSAGVVVNHEMPNDPPHAQAEQQQQQPFMEMDVDDYDDYYVPPHHDDAFMAVDDLAEGVVAGDPVATGLPTQDDLLLGVVDLDADPISVSSDEGSGIWETRVTLKKLEMMRPQRGRRLQKGLRVVMIQKSHRNSS